MQPNCARPNEPAFSISDPHFAEPVGTEHPDDIDSQITKDAVKVSPRVTGQLNSLTRRFCAFLDRLGGRRVHHSFLPRDRQEDRFISAGAFTCRAIDKPAGDCADVAPWASTDPTQHRSVCTPSSPVA